MAYVEQFMVSSSTGVKWSNSIMPKVLVIVLISALLVIAVSGFFAYQYIEKGKTAELSNLAQVTSERLSHHLNGPMWAVDYEKVEALLNAEMAEQKIVGVVVRDEDQQTLFAARKRNAQGEVVPSLGSVVGDFIHSYKAVERDGKSIGSVDIYMTKDFLALELKQFAIGLSILALILCLALTITIGISLRTMVVSPIQQLTKAAERITSGDLKQKIDLNRNDEVGYLANTLHRMQLSLRAAVARIRKSNEQSPRTTAKVA